VSCFYVLHSMSAHTRTVTCSCRRHCNTTTAAAAAYVLQAALSRDVAAHLPKQLLPAGHCLVTWRQLQQQQQQPARAAAASRHSSKSSTATTASSSSTGQPSRKASSSSVSADVSRSDQGSREVTKRSSSSSSSGIGMAALHCRIAAVMERLPGCAQW
jgi:hypothetical protein